MAVITCREALVPRCITAAVIGLVTAIATVSMQGSTWGFAVSDAENPQIMRATRTECYRYTDDENSKTMSGAN